MSISIRDTTYRLPGHRLVRPERFHKAYAALGWLEIGRVDEMLVIAPPAPRMAPVPDAEQPDEEATMEAHVKAMQAGSVDPDLALAQCLQCIRRFGTDVTNGDGKALWRLAQIATEATTMLGIITEKRPAALAPIARDMVQWPLMKSTNPRNSYSDELLKGIALGAAHPINLDADSKWQGDVFAMIAWSIYEYLRDLPKVTGCKPLPPLTRATGKLWWDNGWAFFCKTYPNPHLVPDLDRLITAPSKRTSPGKIREELKRKIRDRFMAIAKR